MATSTNDPAAAGDLYQWGRLTDGHEKRNSPVSATRSSTDVPGNGNFITGTDWRSTPNNNLWQGVNGANNPCPSGFRIPTQAEFLAEQALFSPANSAGAFASPLKLTQTGYRLYFSGVVQGPAGFGYYVTSTVSGNNQIFAVIGTTTNNFSVTVRGFGFAVRCIKD